MIVRSVFAQIKPASKDDPGQVSEGFYTVTDGMLTMTAPDGEPVKHPTEGLLYQHRLERNDSASAIAAMLTKRIRLHMKGIFTEEQTSFNRTLNYSNEGIA